MSCQFAKGNQWISKLPMRGSPKHKQSGSM